MQLQDIQSRCTLCPECDTNWRWAGHPGPVGHKIAVYVNKKRYPVRRTVFELHKGRPVKKGHCIVTDCADDKCMNPELLREVSKAGVVKREIEAGLIHHAGHKANVALARRRRPSKLGDEKAKEIFLEDAPPGEIAAREGVSRQAVSYIKNQRTYRHIHNNPFKGLMP
jgi:hypothetical protein